MCTIRSVAIPCWTMSCQTRDSKGKPKTTTSLPGPAELVSATRTRGSEEQVAGYSSASTMTGTAPSRCLDVIRLTTVLICQPSAMKVHDGNLEIRSDSEYVVRIATSRVRGEAKKCNEENADLWNEFEIVLRLIDTRRLEFVWVKGHATKVRINRQFPHHSEQGR